MPALEISVRTQADDDVRHGLWLYGHSVQAFPPGDDEWDRVERWLTLFKNNPFGSGMFIVAKHGPDKVVGLLALIDFEMTVLGAPIHAGKLEFWLLEQEAMRLTLPGSTDQLPLLLFNAMRKHASEAGYDVLLIVSKVAKYFLRRNTSRYLSVPLVSFSIAGQGGLSKLGRTWDRIVNKRRVAKLSTALTRIGKESLEFVSVVDTLDQDAFQTEPNALTSSSAKMINFRFPPSRYLKVVYGTEAGPLVFIFTRPAAGFAVHLVHWSGLPSFFAPFAAVLSVVLDRMREAGATSLVIELPAAVLPPDYAQLNAMGFNRSERMLDDSLSVQRERGPVHD